MVAVRLVLVLLVSLGAGWFGALCCELIPDRLPFRGARLTSQLRPTLVVLLCVVLGLACVWRFDDTSFGELVVYVLWFALLVSLSAIDLEHMRLPDAMVFPGFVAALLAVCAVSVLDGDAARIRYALVGSVISFAVLLVAHLISPRGMGFGDVKFAAVLGLMVGWQADTVAHTLSLVLWSLLIGFGAGSVLGVVLLIARRRNQPFPFGPFLALGAGVTVLASRSIIG